MDPITGLLIGQLGSSLLGGLFSPKPQKRHTFGGLVSAPSLLQNANLKTNDLYEALLRKLSQPVDFGGSYAPMVPGSKVHDTAFENPRVLQQPGFDLTADYPGKVAVRRRNPRVPEDF